MPMDSQRSVALKNWYAVLDNAKDGKCFVCSAISTIKHVPYEPDESDEYHILVRRCVFHNLHYEVNVAMD